ncbi:MAG: hypothetical protein SFV55_20130 [Haliscomenobacter sp.]|uniref:hypothetical protein n=1 Tax=Haliscomenobacter sp. TaxID=2717303 RepID=UPI0029A75A00|nr:hypothetical protein [Haliscomenobacter sp.]MDX2070748.1 hypothetical protein [Haliscomenobacter sp.]
MESILKEARLFIENGRAKECIDALQSLTQYPNFVVYKNDLTLFRSRLESLNADFGQGTITYESKNAEETRIKSSILNLITKIDETLKNSLKFNEEPFGREPLDTEEPKFNLINDFFILRSNITEVLFSRDIKVDVLNNPESTKRIGVKGKIFKVITLQGNHQEGKTTICMELKRKLSAEHLDLKSIKKEDLIDFLNQPQNYHKSDKGVWIIDNFEIAIKENEEAVNTFFENISDAYFGSLNFQVLLIMKFNSFVDIYYGTSKILNLKIKSLTKEQQIAFVENLPGGHLFVDALKIGTFEPIEEILGIPFMIEKCCNLLLSTVDQPEVRLETLYEEFYNTIFSNDNARVRKNFLEWIGFQCFVWNYESGFKLFKRHEKRASLELLFFEWRRIYQIKEEIPIGKLIKELYYFFDINSLSDEVNWRNPKVKYFLSKMWLKRLRACKKLRFSQYEINVSD